jgi:uncharacterized protein
MSDTKSDINAFEEKQPSCASLVIEHRVSKGKEKEFQNWQSSLTSAVNQFKGYLRTDVSSPVIGAQEKWYVIVYFDTEEHLGKWVNSPERQSLLKTGEELFGSYKFRSFKTGLESWFSTEAGEFEVNTPPWKQNLIVLLGLYPTVMIQTIIFSVFNLMSYWPLSLSMLINNFVCCSLLTWVVMPPLSHWFKFWLKDNSENSQSSNLRGLALVSTFLMIAMAVFYTTFDSNPLTVLRTLQAVSQRLFS